MSQAHHFYGSTAFNWAVAPTRDEVLAKLARAAGSDTIKRQVKANGGLYAWTCRVNVPQDTDYEIENYAPKGVPLDLRESCNLINAKGKTAALPGKAA